MQFSVIIPAYNAEEFVETCLQSVLRQNFSHERFEVILVDDCSSDSTFQIASRLTQCNANLIIAQTERNSGPGIARNVGLSKASGDWVLFLDSDDYLDCHALNTLSEYLDRQNEPLDATGFNWVYASTCNDHSANPGGGRRDHQSLGLDRNNLIKRYLSLRMDGSVIYTAVRKSLIVENNIQFAAGYHEDVDYIFKVYWYARKVCYVNKVLYFKRQRADSIVGTVSARHICGFMRAWQEIANFVTLNGPEEWEELLPWYGLGLIGVLATRVREIYRLSSSLEEAAELYVILYRCYLELHAKTGVPAERPSKTKYNLIATKFIDTMRDRCHDDMSKARTIKEYMDDVMAKTWSCTDLHNSLFLAPNQIRTCCKRFFVDGRMRGDVSLMDISEDDVQPSCDAVLKGKQVLLDKINSGETSGCDGCPFLEFRSWGPLTQLDVKYLSMEYHSICNLRCSYCSETYYGGMRPKYDVSILVEELLEKNALANCGVVVWGGGEPAVDNAFAPLISYLAAALPRAHQTVLTNSVLFSDVVQRLLGEGRASVTTSIDAGADETYTLVRGRAKLGDALDNLEKYVTAKADSVTIKYIFTEQNSSLKEVMAFCSLMRRRSLAGCNVQISCDFKKETVSVDMAISMVVMYGLLSDAGFSVIYFDDLLRQRLTEIHSTSERVIEAKLAELKLERALANKADYKSVAIWGAGWQAKYLIEKSSFFRHVKAAFLVDDTTSKIGGRFLGYDVVAPSALLNSDIPVVIAAVQGCPGIYKSFLALGIDKARLITGLIL